MFTKLRMRENDRLQSKLACRHNKQWLRVVLKGLEFGRATFESAQVKTLPGVAIVARQPVPRQLRARKAFALTDRAILAHTVRSS